MIVDCCAQQRTYEKFYGLLAERFCRLRKEFQEAFERIARDTYNTIHRFEYNKLRNMACLVAHLLSTDAISWNVSSKKNESHMFKSLGLIKDFCLNNFFCWFHAAFLLDVLSGTYGFFLN